MKWLIMATMLALCGCDSQETINAQNHHYRYQVMVLKNVVQQGVTDSEYRSYLIDNIKYLNDQKTVLQIGLPDSEGGGVLTTTCFSVIDYNPTPQ